MGLDATWFRELRKRDDVIFDGDGEPTNVDNYVRPTVNGYFPGREGSLEHRGIYEYAAEGEAFHGAYSAYSRWREWLAKLAGYPPVVDPRFPFEHSNGAFQAEGGPFHEMIMFSDSEGVLGPEVCAKLAKDFAEWDERAKAEPQGDQRGVRDRTFYEVYRLWRLAFEEAANNGCVTFH